MKLIGTRTYFRNGQNVSVEENVIIDIDLDSAGFVCDSSEDVWRYGGAPKTKFYLECVCRENGKEFEADAEIGEDTFRVMDGTENVWEFEGKLLTSDD